MLRRFFSYAALAAASLYLSACNSGALPATSISAQRPLNSSLTSNGPLVYVSSTANGTVTAFSASDNGDVSPKFRLGADSQLTAVSALQLDQAGKLFVCCGANGINIYAPGASAGAQPIATIGGSGNPFFPPGSSLTLASALALSRLDDVYVGENLDQPGRQVEWVDGGAFGCVTTHFIQGSDTDINGPEGLAVDNAGFLYGAESAADFGSPGISVHAPKAVGDAAPVRFISGPHTGLTTGSVHAVAIGMDGLIYVLSQDPHGFGGFISVFQHDANGDEAPMRVLSGPQSMLNGAFAMAIDRNNKLYVSNSLGNNITIYDGTASGPLKPIQVIGGPHTGINQPSQIAVSNAP